MIRQDLSEGIGFCLVDPHGSLYRDVLEYCAFKVLRREIILVNLSQPSHVMGFNPFKKIEDGDISVQVDRRISATMHAWGVENTDETPTLERTLRLIYTALIEQGLSFHHAQHFIDFNSQEIRMALVKRIESKLVRKEWEELEELKAKDWRNEVLSAKNRLFRLLTSKAITRFLSASGETVDLAQIIESGKILLVNLAPSDHLSAENARVFGTLLINEFFEVACRRNPLCKESKPYYLYLDEFQNFVSLDIVKMLDQVRKFGLFTVLAHQRFGQLGLDLCDAVLTNCRIKAVFGGLPVESAEMMAKELFIGELDPQKIKVSIYQTKFWPTYSRDKVYSYAQSSGHSVGRGENRAFSTGRGQVAGESFQPGDWFGSGGSSGQSVVLSHSSSEVLGHHSSETHFTGDAFGEADVPILLPVPFKELSSIQFFTPEEQLLELTAALKEQFGRHCFIKIHNQKTQPLRVPLVEPYRPPQRNFDWYVQEILKKTRTSPASVVDAKIADEEVKLKKTPRGDMRREQRKLWEYSVGKE